MAQTNLSVRIEEKDKKSFEMFCNQTGMNVSVAINMFIKTVLRENKLPFEIKADPFYSQSNIKYLEKIVADIENGKAKFEEHKLVEDDERAWEEYCYWQFQDKKTLKRINALIRDIQRDSFSRNRKTRSIKR